MAVKRRNQKRRQREEMEIRAVKIKCCYCDIKDDCKHRESKERTEKKGIVTLCCMTPNIPKAKLRQLAKLRAKR